MYRDSAAVTDFKGFPARSHYIIAEPGWREVADYALSWASAQRPQPSSGVHSREPTCPSVS
jgi:hypothetical protein